jgi:hypothetical protein
MTVVKMAEYHELGWAIKRAMSAPTIRVRSQKALGEFMTKGGYPIGQQLISDYMRLKEVRDQNTDEVVDEVPRAYAPMEFIAALIAIGRLDEVRREDVINGWLEILPEKRRDAVLGLCELLRTMDVPGPAWREMLVFEQDLEDEGEHGGESNKSSEGRAS